MKTSDRLLFYTGSIDFQHLEPHIKMNEFEAVYSSDPEEFARLCLENTYELIVHNSYGEAGIDTRILKSLRGSKNLYTPVLIIAGKEGADVMSQSLKHQFDLIIFPFSREELITRIEAAIRRKKMELGIHNNLLDYRILFENFPSGILQTDLQGNFIRFNRELMNILGMSGLDFSGINFFHLCHPDDYLIERKNLDRLLRREADHAGYEIRLINNDGRTIVCKTRARYVDKNENNEGSFIFSVEKIS